MLFRSYLNGLTLAATAKRHDCHPARVLYILKKNDVPRRTLKEAFLLRQSYDAEVVQDYLNNMSVTQIAKKSGFALTTIRDILTRNKVTRRSRLEAQRLIRHLDEAKISKDYLNGLSTKDIAQKHGCTSSTVLRILKRNDVPKRKPDVKMTFSSRQMEIIKAAMSFLSANFEEGDWDHMHQPISYDEVNGLIQHLDDIR